MSVIRWIHLSDLHMRIEDIDQCEIIFEALWEDVENKIKKSFPVDFIVFTGDIAYHGFEEEYRKAISDFFEPLLQVSGIGKDRLFLVPGNHDVSREITKHLQNPLKKIKTEDNIRQLLINTTTRQVLFQSQKSYKSFFLRYIAPNQEDFDPLFACNYSFVKNNHSISLIGLNSAWLSGFNLDDEGAVDDRNKLAIGEYQIREALSKCANSDLLICLHHHPFDWLFDFDSNDIQRWIIKKCDISLRGHLHQSDFFEETGLIGKLISIPCGAIYDTRKSPHSFNYVELNLETGKGTVYFRKYTENHGWQKDIELTGSKLDGKCYFNIGQSKEDRSDKAIKEPLHIRESLIISYKPKCEQDLKMLGLSSNELEELVNTVFAGHKNYYMHDLENYPLSVQKGYIVFFSKNGSHIVFESVVKSKGNEIQLSKWNAIAAAYRLCTRYGYREIPERLAIIRGMLERVVHKHQQVLALMVDYFEEFEDLVVDAQKREGAKRFIKKYGGKNKLLQEAAKGNKDLLPTAVMVARENEHNKTRAEGILGKLISASNELTNAQECQQEYLDENISRASMINLCDASLEASLMHIHQIITNYLPKI